MQNEPARLVVKVAIDQAGAFDRKRS
jgi:hypothetical protein